MSETNQSATPRLPLSPNSIRNKRFQPNGRRGYDRADVDHFISQVAADVQLWIDEVTRQRAEIERFKNWMRSQNDPKFRHDEISAEAVGVLARAQHQADYVIATAREQAQAIVGDAGAQAAAIVEAAHQRADHVAHAYRASAGRAYSPEGEDLRRRVAIMQTFLGTLQAVQGQLPVVEAQLGGLVAAFSYEVDHLHQLVAEGDGQPAYRSPPTPPPMFQPRNADMVPHTHTTN